MLISVVNLAPDKIKQTDLRRYARAVNYQLEHHVAPAWDMVAELEVVDRPAKRRDTRRIDRLRGDAVIYVDADSGDSEYDGYHEANGRGIPYGVVFADISHDLGEDISVTLSHEALELLADPQSNLLVPGPHPNRKERRQVLFWYELCDAVQTETYEIKKVPAVKGVKLSNFVLPLYFTLGEQEGGRNDFLGNGLKSFGVNPGGYVGYTNPGNWVGGIFDADEVAKKRRAIKGRAKKARRSTRYLELKKRLREFKLW
jgi:hypothetical protein